MQIEDTFDVAAPPERVFAFLLDINRIIACVPGAELGELVGRETFKGRVRVKAGPVTMRYKGTARIVERDDTARTATLEGTGQEADGGGMVRMRSRMAVVPAETGSTVRLLNDVTVSGRVAQFGRGFMEDISRRMVGEMADCIKRELERPSADEASSDRPAAPGAPRGAPEAAKPINALALMWGVLRDRVARLFGRRRRSAGSD